MSVYLRDIPLVEAQNCLENALLEAGLSSYLGSEVISLDEKALNRVLAAPIWAKLSSPHYHASAMDGFAIRSIDSTDATDTNPINLIVSKKTVYVDTGDPLPDWADAVIPIEHTEPLDEDGQLSIHHRHPHAVRVRASYPPWRHVRPMGEDIVATQLVLAAGHTLRPYDLGAIAACGHSQVTVARRPIVGILPTGTELKPVGTPVKPGEIIEYNSMVLAAQINSWGGVAIRFPITDDVFENISERAILAAKECDLILINAGSSAGSEDFTAQVVESLGDLLVHGVAVRPGHPVIIGMIHQPGCVGGNVPVFGVPGYPVSAAMTAEIFIKPLIFKWLGKRKEKQQTLNATLTRKVTSPAGDDDFMRVVIGKVDEKVLAAPLSRGAGVITSLVQADGIVVLPRGVQGLPTGSPVDVRLLRSIHDLETTIFAIGSHDIILDVMAQYLAKSDRRLVSANVGSLAGLLALQRGESHLAGSHLLDPVTGLYNLKYIDQYLPQIPVQVITLVGRQQGLLVNAGNPQQIQGLADITRQNISFVNRQRGAGTRVLLDYHLKQLGIAPEDVRGYEHEEYTHLAVAAAVSSGRASCGLGIAAAATALGLDFIPLFSERYDLVIPTQHYQSDLLVPLIELLNNIEFRQLVSEMPGYDVSEMGRMVDKVT